jgi:uncharacterized protein (DUF488 family)
MSAGLKIWTIGHSTRLLCDFLALLAEFRIQALADVRSFPGSRRYPQYGKQSLEECLPQHHIAYRWMPALGGRRRPRADSTNLAWRNSGFRGYADHMQTMEFEAGLEDLIELGRKSRTAVMCAEAQWWRCHRSLVADALLARGLEVEHIIDPVRSMPHTWTAPARLVNGCLTYASAPTEVTPH